MEYKLKSDVYLNVAITYFLPIPSANKETKVPNKAPIAVVNCNIIAYTYKQNKKTFKIANFLHMLNFIIGHNYRNL